MTKHRKAMDRKESSGENGPIRTQQEVAERLRMSRQAVARAEQSAIQKISLALVRGV